MTFLAGKALQMLNNRYGPLWRKYRSITTESKSAAHNQLPSKSHCVCHYTVFYSGNNQCNWRTKIWGQCIFLRRPSTQLSASVKYKAQNYFPLTKQKPRLPRAPLSVRLMLGNFLTKAIKGVPGSRDGSGTWAPEHSSLLFKPASSV